jgi:uncharacterized glyoxalase superfamily protein PhnB/catechol 2,3-dioxygenase-like lactoylglutathione lyase family enzyme
MRIHPPEDPPMSTANVRYIVDDVASALSFYTDQLGFDVEMNPAPGFAKLAKGELRLLLNQPGAGGGGQAAIDGQMPAPGGWNRVQIEVDDLESMREQLKAHGARFRADLVRGQGGKQLLLEDPSGNLVELFEPKPERGVKPVPDGHHTVTPFLLADDVSKLLTFIESAFGGKVEYSMQSADGVVRHATIRVGDSLIMVSKGTDIYGVHPAMLHLYVLDVDIVYAQALQHGASMLREPVNEFYGDRVAAVKDEWNNQWWIATHVEDVSADEMQRREAEFRRHGS